MNRFLEKIAANVFDESGSFAGKADKFKQMKVIGGDRLKDKIKGAINGNMPPISKGIKVGAGIGAVVGAGLLTKKLLSKKNKEPKV